MRTCDIAGWRDVLRLCRNVLSCTGFGASTGNLGDLMMSIGLQLICKYEYFLSSTHISNMYKININKLHALSVLNSEDRERVEVIIDRMRAEMNTLFKVRGEVEDRISTLQESIDVLERVLGQ